MTLKTIGIGPATPHVTRRGLLQWGAAGLLFTSTAGWSRGAVAQAGQRGVHGLSIFGDLKYPPGFSHFDYVNPEAPIGGRLSILPGYWYNNQNTDTFNTLNGYVTRGEAPPRLELTFDSLVAPAYDEPDSVYGLVAERIDVSDDGNELTYHLRSNPTFHDGSPLTAEDVAFSTMLLKEKGHPSIRVSLRDLVLAEATDERTMVMRFNGDQSRFAPLLAASQPIFSKAFYADKDFEGAALEPPLGSGPYRIGRFETGRSIDYDRVPDYWGQDLAVNKGMHRFDTIRVEFFRDRQAGFEAFKKGVIEVREEFTSQTWATGYDFPAMQDGRVVKLEFPTEKRPSLQCWFLNTRREKLADVRVREAIGLCFDFEWTNEQLFYGAYKRADSVFEKSNLQAQGSPIGAELDLLEGIRDLVPETVFGAAVTPPVSDASGSDRTLLRRAVELLQEAGWSRDGDLLRNAAGEPLEIEFLIRSPTFERLLGPFVRNLTVIGVQATTRLVDASQFQSRLNDFDFDIVGRATAFSATPLEGLNTYFGSEAAETPGASNFSGIRNPGVDALLEAVAASTSREDLQAACSALDRVIRAHHYVIPNWYSDTHRMALWDKFGWPEQKPDYFFPIERTWWVRTG